VTTTGAAELAGRPAGWRPPRWVALLFALGALVLLPWVAVLVVALPSAHRAAHWDIAWAGFDVGLALLLAAVAFTAWRRSPWFEGAATSAATLLFVDAWFDVLTSSSRAELALAVCEAAFVELPLAVLCLVLAYDAARRLFAPSVSTPRRRRRGDRLCAARGVSGHGMQALHGSL
jgi:hypothetical protein